MATFNVPEWLAETLDVGDDDIERTSGPTSTFSGIEAEYAVRSETVETVVRVIVSWSSPSQYRDPRRVVTAVFESGPVIDEIASETEIEW